MVEAVRNVLTEWTRVLIGCLIDAGVRRVVISPGSRSTPLVAAITARRAKGKVVLTMD